MGFIKNMLGKSLFTDDSYKGAIGKESSNQVGFEPGYSVIILQPTIKRLGQSDKEPSVMGIIKDKVELEYTAEWTPMGGFASIMQSVPYIGQGIANAGTAVVGAVNPLINFAGGADLGAVYSSKMIYHKSGYLRISPSFRVVDWKGIGDPLAACFLIASFTTPFEGQTSILDLIKDKLKEIREASEAGGVEKLSDKLGLLLDQGFGLTTDAVSNIKENLKQIGGQPVTNIINTITEEIEKDYLSIRSSPVPLAVTIGQYFWHPDMVLMDARVSFSREMTKAGPLFADITLSLSSRKIIGGLDDIGIQKKPFRLIEIDTDQAESNYTRI